MSAPLFRGSAQVLVPNREGLFLTVTNRRWGGYSCPGGAMEEGETARAAARRELAEETGLVVSEDDLLPVYGGVIWSQPHDAGPPWCCFAFRLRQLLCDTLIPCQMELGTKLAHHSAADLATTSLYPKYYQELWAAQGVDYEVEEEAQEAARLLPDPG